MLALSGIGSSMVFSTVAGEVMTSVDPEQIGIASGTNNALRDRVQPAVRLRLTADPHEPRSCAHLMSLESGAAGKGVQPLPRRRDQPLELTTHGSPPRAWRSR